MEMLCTVALTVDLKKLQLRENFLPGHLFLLSINNALQSVKYGRDCVREAVG